MSQKSFARRFSRASSAVLLAGGLVSGALAQDAYPNKPVEVIVPYAAGGGVDAMARAFAREAGQRTGQSWTVVNRDGGGGLVGFSALANAAPDGYKVMFSPASALTNAPFVTKAMPFKAEQIEPVCQVFENVFAIAVRQDSPIRSLQDLVARAKAEPGKLSYGHAGPASVPHLAVAAMEKAQGLRFNAIPYRGDGAMLPQLLGGQIDFGAPAISSIGGKGLRVLAVLSDKRHPALADAPALTEAGFPAVTPGLNGVYVPAGTPKPVVDKLQGLCKQVLESEDFKKAAQTLQQIPTYLPADAFKQRIDRTYKMHADLVPDLNLEKK
ncbi:Bug family tripartite tricarboxylate transporter substrate binding protein [Ramlibacter rhizophilus]|uniref:Tripartite tricarboxylate transporter substrate binding protein n=1 Tax=Ramlibacter rhizophilus TaxID=1781167 RepID=A0A4Z0BH61_9BURK|nr:tripartite tricarboxylate transporter substrate binding protein [Ramlibacter rhizophilus]TFY97464.1 tripartite tricarboxylate transporter substrate binding protein [Ramlibacter rhizophilus]